MNTTKSKKRVLSRVVSMALCLVMIVAMFCTVSFSASAENEKVMDARSGVVQIQVWFVDPVNLQATPLHTGSGFLINDTTIVTCDHVATGYVDEFYDYWAQVTNAVYGGNRTAEDVKNNLEIRIQVYRDVYVQASVQKSSSEMDYAILTLHEPLQNRTPLKLRSSGTLKQTENIYALGFPGDINDITDQSTYLPTDVSVTSGTVTKVGVTNYKVLHEEKFGDEYYYALKSYENLDTVNHSARITGGNSGGPLVDDNGSVVGINTASSDERNLAVSSDQLIEVLDALGIQYSKVGATDPDPVPVPDPDPDPTLPTVSPIIDPTEGSNTVPAPTKDEEEEEEKESEGFFANTTNIIILAVGAVVLILVVVIVIVVVGGKKKKTPVAVVAAPAPQAPAAPAPRAQAPVPPAPPVYQPVQRPMGAPAQTAAGETTVLNQGAGETTVLAKKVNGGKLIRKSTGEVVEINNEHFVIGRERKNVNYCISNNTNISRSHAKILVKSGGVYLVDMGTANGSFVNGVKAEPRHEIQLKNGDKITLADEDLEYQI